jgi:hypothetical protein
LDLWLHSAHKSKITPRQKRRRSMGQSADSTPIENAASRSWRE